LKGSQELAFGIRLNYKNHLGLSPLIIAKRGEQGAPVVEAVREACRKDEQIEGFKTYAAFR
jgi:hypothetical protein